MSEHACDGRGYDPDCKRDIYPPDGKRCVFHSEVPTKDPQPLRDALAEMKRTKVFDCRGWVFPCTVDLAKQHFHPKPVVYGGFPMDDLSFMGTVFLRGANFEGAIFNGTIEFQGAKFLEYVSFKDAIFSGDAGFMDCDFPTTFFNDVQFKGEARFIRAVFQKGVFFKATSFLGEVNFGGAQFKAVWFTHASFEKSPSFQSCTFHDLPVFDGVRFGAHTTFYQIRFSALASFARTDLSLVTFRRCIMGSVELGESHNVAEAEFDDCVWGTPPPLVYEEGVARRSDKWEDYQRTQQVYREVRRSLENHKHFQEANRFAYRELEMRRLAYLADRKQWWERLWGQIRANLLSFEALYHQLSSYGESWLKPLAWLLISAFAIFPLAYAAIGITLGHTTYSLGGQIWEPGTVIGFSLRTAALFSMENMPDVGGWGLVLQVVERVWSPFLAVLFTLAVRRRFRR